MAGPMEPHHLLHDLTADASVKVSSAQALLLQCSELLKVRFGGQESNFLAKTLLEELYQRPWLKLMTTKANELALSPGQAQQLKSWLEQVLQGTPWQYVVGYAPFLDLRIPVRPGVLIPRPETEELVQLALADMQSSDAQAFGSVVWDVCTGSGCIALAMDHLLGKRGNKVVASDYDEAALAIASENVLALNSQVLLVAHDALSDKLPAEIGPASCNLVISNPPYVLHSDAAEMAANVLDHEPHVALFAPDDDALAFYRSIGYLGTLALKQGGLLWFECHERLTEQVAQLLYQQGYEQCTSVVDFRDRPRFVKATWSGQS